MVVNMKSLRRLFILFVLWAPFGGLVFAQDTFFKGKTVRIIVPFVAGGGYDIYSHIMGRHMGKYVPGNPVFVVENMTGAGGLIGINHVYKVAKPDGTPGTPKDRVELLRKAFMDTMKDPDFAAELKKAKLDLNPLDGATLERNVREIFALDSTLGAKLKEILK